jgi:8-oxo-dGTP pyrophosphatase MutT (NUDIX family)
MSEPRAAVTPTPAATVLLLRDDPAGGFSVFMVQRSMKSSFMPGAYVFPGGKVEEEDAEQSVRLSEQELLHRFGGELCAGSARSHLVAAAREVAEETGVLLDDPSCMHVFSHWVTPEIESRRFDTWFFAGRMPPGAAPTHDDFEVVASKWVNPVSALESYGDGDLQLAPPTYYTLWDLARFSSVDEVLADTRERSVVAIQPEFREVEGRWTILLPGDALYPSDSPVAGPTRIVMGEEGRWWLVQSSA